MAEIRWLPLESNPDVLNKYAAGLGVPTSWQFVDVYGLDPDLLSMVPQPVGAIILLYPGGDKSKEALGPVDNDAKVYYMKQTIGNACGTVAIVHSLANNANQIDFEAGKPFSNFLNATKDMDPQQRSVYIETDTAMGAAHEDSAKAGQTKVPSADDKVDFHFVALVQVNGKLYELDGRKAGPVCHGDSSADTFLNDAAGVVKKFVERDPSQVNFNMIALAKV